MPFGGAFLVIFGLAELRALGDYRMMIYGVLLVLFVIFLPQGLARLGLRIRLPGSHHAAPPAER